MNISSKETFLSVEEVARLLGLPEVTIQRWEHQGKIPYKVIKGKIVFKKSEIIRWANAHDLAIREKQGKKNDIAAGLMLTDAINAGGIYRNVQGNDIYSVFENSLNQLSFIPKEDYKKVFEELLNREELTSTGIGNGIAIPHTRSRLDLKLKHAHVPVFFPEQPLLFNAIDGKPVWILFMIFTSSVKEHLKMLSRISFVLQQPSFRELLKPGISDDDLIRHIRQIEDEAR